MVPRPSKDLLLQEARVSELSSTGRASELTQPKLLRLQAWRPSRREDRSHIRSYKESVEDFHCLHILQKTWGQFFLLSSTSTAKACLPCHGTGQRTQDVKSCRNISEFINVSCS